MNADLIVTLIVLAIAVILFFRETIPAGQTALFASASLLGCGVLTGEQVFAGFSNVATVTVGAMFVVSAGVYHTGAVNAVSDIMTGLLRRGEWAAMAAITVGAGALSAFINNTTVVVIMLPLLLRCSGEAGVSPSKLLMPLSFACMLGGTCTLVGTSTNLVVSSVAVDYGLHPIGMFELAPVGLALFGVGVVYLLTVGRALLPERRGQGSLQASFDVGAYITDLRVLTDSPLPGARLDEVAGVAELDGDVISLTRADGGTVSHPSGQVELRARDTLRVRCGAHELSRLLGSPGLSLASAADPDPAALHLIEAVVGPRSGMIGLRLSDVDGRERFQAVPLAIRQRGRLRHDHLGDVTLGPGDVLLLDVDPGRLGEFGRRGDFVLVSELPLTRFRTERRPVAVAILVGVVAVAAAGWLSIAAAALIGAVLTLLTGCARQEEALEAIDWNVMMLLAGVISLGTALESSGAAELLAEAFVDVLGGAGPYAAVGALYLLAALATSFLSNNATAALLTPIAVAIAAQLGASARPFVITIAFGASTALLTPIGYQTNTLVYGPGQYRFSDFTRVGGPLMLPLGVIVTLLVPWVWPLEQP